MKPIQDIYGKLNAINVNEYVIHFLHDQPVDPKCARFHGPLYSLNQSHYIEVEQGCVFSGARQLIVNI